MSITAVNIGSAANDGTGDPLRTAFQKLNANDAYLESIAGGGGDGLTEDQQLASWVEGGAYEPTAITYDSDGVVTTATVKWPDASAGTFTTTTKDATHIAINAYTISHTDSGKTVTQAAVTRNSDGAVTTKPALTVA